MSLIKLIYHHLKIPQHHYYYNGAFGYLILGILLFAFPTPALASIDLQDVLENLRELLGPLTTLLLIISFTAGIGMVFRGLGLLKAFGMPLTQASRPGELAGPLVYIFVGTILIYLPSTTDILTKTIFGNDKKSIVDGGTLNLAALGRASDQLLGYAPITIEGKWADLADTVVLYVQFIGFLAFIRGWFIISHAGQPGVQPGSISKGITHIIGGLLAVNFLPMFEVLSNTILGN